ncbi:claudin-18-like [Pecten maximus]|uniref:claudin-18-like n=1 Tax=Pecten maximus TaxID=6579 RepID=UPI001458D0C4|nr:claudin-18-like [Pecten maximus]
MGCSDSSVLLKIAFVILPLALVLQIAGLATPSWSSITASIKGVSASQSIGLWATCATEAGKSQCVSYTDVEDWLKVCRAFAIIGMLAVAAAAILEVLCTVALSKDSHKIAYILATIIAFVGAGACILACIIWAAKVGDVLSGLDLSYSFALSIVAGGLSGIGGILVAIDLCK